MWEIYKCKHALVDLRSKKTKIIKADLTTKQATSIYRGNKYSCKTISVVFINASSNRFRRKFCSYKKRTFDGRLLF